MTLQEFIKNCVIQSKNAGAYGELHLEVYVYPDFLLPEGKWEIIVSPQPHENLSKITLKITI